MRRLSQALGEFVAGAILGALCGYIAAILLAPREGSASRAQLGAMAAGMTDAPGGFWKAIESRVQAAVAEAQRAAAEARQSLEAVAGRAAVGAEDAPHSAGAI